jgi:hypothetical protein
MFTGDDGSDWGGAYSSDMSTVGDMETLTVLQNQTTKMLRKDWNLRSKSMMATRMLSHPSWMSTLQMLSRHGCRAPILKMDLRVSDFKELWMRTFDAAPAITRTSRLAWSN